MLRRNKEAIFIINPSLRRSNSLPQLSCKKEREGERESLKIDVRLQCSLDLQLDSLIQPYSPGSMKERRERRLNQEKHDLNSYQRNHLGSTIVIIPGHLKNCLQKSKKKNCKKKTRFLDLEHEEFSSGVGRYTIHYTYTFIHTMGQK